MEIDSVEVGRWVEIDLGSSVGGHGGLTAYPRPADEKRLFRALVRRVDLVRNGAKVQADGEQGERFVHAHQIKNY